MKVYPVWYVPAWLNDENASCLWGIFSTAGKASQVADELIEKDFGSAAWFTEETVE